MPKFQIVSPHVPTECLQAMDHWLLNDPKFLKKAWNGCDVGDHTVYAVVDAATAEEATERVPPFIRHKTRVVQVRHTTVKQIITHRDDFLRAELEEAGREQVPGGGS